MLARLLDSNESPAADGKTPRENAIFDQLDAYLFKSKECMIIMEGAKTSQRTNSLANEGQMALLT